MTFPQKTEYHRKVVKKFHNPVCNWPSTKRYEFTSMTLTHFRYFFWQCISDPLSRPPSNNNKILTSQEIGTREMKFSTMNRKWRDRNPLAGIHFSRLLAPSWGTKLTRYSSNHQFFKIQVSQNDKNLHFECPTWYSHLFQPYWTKSNLTQLQPTLSNLIHPYPFLLNLIQSHPTWSSQIA